MTRNCLAQFTSRVVPSLLSIWPTAFALAPHASARPFVQVARAAGDEHALVDGRRAQNVTFQGVPWSVSKLGCVEGGGAGNAMYSKDEIGPGDFSVHVKLAQVEVGGRGAGIALGSDVFLNLDAGNRSMQLEGTHFGGKPQVIGESVRWVKPNVALAIDLRRIATKVAVVVDQNQIAEFDLGPGFVGRVGLVPNNTTLRVYEWSLAGAVQTPQESDELKELQPKINAAIDRGVMALMRAQQRDGSWGSAQIDFPGGATALSVYTLLKCGLRTSDAPVARALRYLEPIVANETYSAGLMLMAYEATGDPKFKERMKPILANVLDWQRQGVWSYPRIPRDNWDGWTPALGNQDLSNTQYAVLGLRAAAHAGLEVPPKTWLELIDSVLRHQENPTSIDVVLSGAQTGSAKQQIAGFKYNFDGGARGSMTAAGVSELVMARDALGPKLSGKAAADVGRAIQMGVNWMDHYFAADKNPFGEDTWLYYWLYGVERVGSLLDVEDLGSHHWYAEGARYIVSKQGDDGTWSTNMGAPMRANELDTCFALLFLRRATRVQPRTGAGARDFFEKRDDSGQPVRVAAEGDGEFAVHLGGFSDAVIAENGHGLVAGLRVAYVEYLVDGVAAARVDGDPKTPWTRENFAAKLKLADPGDYQLVARAHLVAPDAALEVVEPTKVFDSLPLKLHSNGTSESWLTELAERRTRNLFNGRALTVTTSSNNGGDTGPRAFDGVESTRWMCKNDDKAPMLVVELQKPVMASQLVLYSHCNSPALRGKHDVIQRVSVHLNHTKDNFEVTADADELKPIIVPLGKNVPVQRLEIRIPGRKPGTAWPGYAGFTEIALEK